MKIPMVPLATALAAGVALSAMGAQAPQLTLSAEKIASIKTSLTSVKLVEAPYRAAHLVMAASKSERSAVVRAAVAEVLEQHPTVVSATVRAVLTVAPDEVAAVMEAVMDKTPNSFLVAMSAVGQLNPSMAATGAAIVGDRLPSARESVAEFASQFAPVDGASQEFSAHGAPKFGTGGPSIVKQSVVSKGSSNGGAAGNPGSTGGNFIIVGGVKYYVPQVGSCKNPGGP